MRTVKHKMVQSFVFIIAERAITVFSITDFIQFIVGVQDWIYMQCLKRARYESTLQLKGLEPGICKHLEFQIHGFSIMFSLVSLILAAVVAFTVELPIRGQIWRSVRLKRGVRLWAFKNVMFVCSWEHDQVSTYQRCLLVEVWLHT